MRGFEAEGVGDDGLGGGKGAGGVKVKVGARGAWRVAEVIELNLQLSHEEEEAREV